MKDSLGFNRFKVIQWRVLTNVLNPNESANVRMRGRRVQGRRGVRCGQDRMWCRGRREDFHGQGEGRPDWAATETLSAAWLPPKDSASFSPRASHSCVSSLSSATTLSFTFLFPPFICSLLHPPVPPARSLFLAPFLHFSHFLCFFTPSSSGPLQTLSSGLRGGGGWLRWWDGDIEGGQKP